VNGVTFDAGGLIALDRNDRRVLALLMRAKERGVRVTVPATALPARTGTSDIADAHVVVCAERAGQAVVTSDANDLRRLSPGLQLVVV
jgi:hypothetical protein